MSDLPILARAPLPEPLTWVMPLFSHDGRRAVVLGASGRLWRLEIDPARRAVDVVPLPIAVPREAGGDWRLRPLAGSHALDRLLVWTDALRVYDLPSAQVVYEEAHPRGRVACLSPGGRFVIGADEEAGWTVDLLATPRTPGDTGDLHLDDPEAAEAGAEPADPEPVYLDHVDFLAAHPCPDAEDDEWAWGDEMEHERFWLAAGCYGFVLVQRMNGSDWGVERVAGKTRTVGGLVYDPTELVRPFGARHLFVLHGHRCGLTAIDPATGARHDCVVRAEGHPYAFFRDPAVSADAPLAVVQCRDGAFLWEPGACLRPLPAVPGQAWKVYGGDVLCADGDELVWVALPEGAAGAR